MAYANVLSWLHSESDAKAIQAHAINKIQEMKAKMLVNATTKEVETDNESQEGRDNEPHTRVAQVQPRFQIHSTNP